MPDRAVIPLIVAGAGGFIAGLITAVTQTYTPESAISASASSWSSPSPAS